MYQELKDIIKNSAKVREVTYRKEVEGRLITFVVFEGFIDNIDELKKNMKVELTSEGPWFPLVTYSMDDGSCTINGRTVNFEAAKQRLRRFILGMIPAECLGTEWSKMADEIFVEFTITALQREGIEISSYDDYGFLWNVVSACTDVIENGKPKMVPLVKFASLTPEGPVTKADANPFLCLDFDVKFPYGSMKVSTCAPNEDLMHKGGVYRNFEDAIAFIDAFCMNRAASKSRH